MRKRLDRIFNAITFLCISLICVIGLGFGLRASGVTGENFVTKLLSFAGTTADDEYTKGPERSKTVDSNGDGSYKLSLTVKGESVTKISKANVIVVMDTSGSMDYSAGYVYTSSSATDEYGMYGLVDGEYVALTRHGKKNNYTWTYGNNVSYTGTRYTRAESSTKRLAAAKTAVNDLANSLLSLNGQNGNPSDTFEMALVSFSNSGSVKVGKTTSYSTFQSAVNALKANGGTNWESALETAYGLSFNDNDQTYIIFVSDGNPTFRDTKGEWSDWNSTYQAYGTGTETDENIARSYKYALVSAKKIVNNNKYILYSIGAYGSVDRMQQLMSESGAGVANYFSAAETSQLQAALTKILEDIKTAGYGAVEINDGTTANVTTSTGVAHLLTVDTDSFKYYRNGVEWGDAPKATLNADGEVVWNLGNGVLDNDVVYKVTFDVWPSQYTLDLIADLKNGTVKYENLDANIKEYLVEKDGEYELGTNTVAKISYTDTRTEDGPQTGQFRNPPKVATETYTLNIEKKWANALDSRDIPTTGIALDVFRDGEKIDEIVVNELLSWKNHTDIAVGIMKYDSTSNKVTILETGHEYSLGEPEGLTYHWELDSQVVRPMLINNTLTVLIKDTTVTLSSDHETVNGKEYYRIDGKAYYVDNTISQLTATNNRRSYFEFNKQVTGEHIPEHAKFNYRVKIVNSMADLTDEDVTDDDEIWFSVYDTVNKVTVTNLVTTATGPNSSGYYKVESGKEFTVELEAGWNLRALNLPTGSTFEVEETAMATGFIFSKVEGTGVTDGTKKLVKGTIEHYNTPYSITYTNEYRLTDVTVSKVWNDASDQDGIRPTELALVLKGDGTVVNVTPEVTKSGNTWTYVYKALPRYNATGEVRYTVEEPTLPEGYTPSVDGLTITNTHEVYKDKVVVTKTWVDDDNRDVVRPNSIEVVLKANGEVVDAEPVVAKNGNTWTYTYANLDVNEAGEPIVYTAEETTVPTGYTKTKQEGLTIENTHVTTKVNRSVHKEWNDANNQDDKRPESITVKLLADGTEVETFVLNEENGWTATKTGLVANKKVTKEGVEVAEAIVYTWSEVITEDMTNKGYELTGNELDEEDETRTILTNSRTTDKTQSTIVKVWNDDSNRDHKRPESLKVYLNGTEYTLTGTGDRWTKTVENLEKNSNGQPITYTWTEETVNGYTSSGPVVEGTITTFTNSKANETVPVTVTKVWVDGSNRDHSRPTNVTFQLYANDKAYGDPVTFDGNGDTWTYSFGNLNKNEDGEPIVYTVKEVTTPTGYTKEEKGLTVTNTRPTDKTSVSVSKQWVDGNDRDKKRPQKLTVTLKDGETTVATHDLVASEGWAYTFTGLEKNRDGQPIQYTVIEESVQGYTPVSVGDYTTGFRFTNTYTPEEVSFSGIKEWRDANNQDGIRPDSVTVVLMAGEGEDAKEVTRTYATKDNGWAYSFTGLPKNSEGVAIKYSIKELPVDGYETTYGENLIINTHATATTTVSGTKTWSDGNNQDGLQTASVTIKLKANGEYVTDEEGNPVTAVASATNGWTYSFGTLPAKSAGEDIVYTVEEVVPAGYTASYSGYDITNFHTPEVTSVTTSKVWNDTNNNDHVRPESITIRLFADGTEIDHQVVTAEDNWSASFTGLPKYKDGTQIKYTVREDAVDGYTSNVDGYEVTNTHTLATTEVTVNKAWDDADNQDGKRPESVTVKLLADGSETGKSIELNEGNEWTYTWTGLQKLTNGEPIVYTVVEVEETEVTDTEDEVEEVEEEVNGYYATYDSCPVNEETGKTTCVVTNHYNPEKTSFTVNKAWEDATDQDGLRPDEITVELYANDDEEPTLTAQVKAEEGWIYTFEDLDKYRDGSIINYHVVEVEVEGYESVVNGNTITNTHTPETVDVAGTITWDDEDDQDEIRPGEVEICVYADGEKVKCTTVTPDDEWQYEFEDLPKNNNGEEIEYTITENDIDDYEETITGYDVNNKHVPDDGEVLGEDEEFPDGHGTENPGTGDTILPFALLLLTSLGGISITAKKIVDRQK